MESKGGTNRMALDEAWRVCQTLCFLLFCFVFPLVAEMMNFDKSLIRRSVDPPGTVLRWWKERAEHSRSSEKLWTGCFVPVVLCIIDVKQLCLDSKMCNVSNFFILGSPLVRVSQYPGGMPPYSCQSSSTKSWALCDAAEVSAVFALARPENDPEEGATTENYWQAGKRVNKWSSI